MLSVCISAILLLTACGGNKYDDAINDVIKHEKKTRKETNIDSDERLGHASMKTTIDVYDHLYPNKQKEMADKLDDLL